MLAIVAGILLSLASNHETACSRLDISELHNEIELVISASDIDSEGAALADLMEYWREVCRSDRVNADEDIIQEISRLLNAWSTRFIAASMLVDIGTKLEFATDMLQKTLDDQRRIDQESVREAYPGVAFVPSLTTRAVLCTLKKANSGRRDEEHCWVFREYDSGY